MSKTITIHSIPNAHIDPVWRWDWREGLNQEPTTCCAVLDLGAVHAGKIAAWRLRTGKATRINAVESRGGYDPL